MLPTIIAGASSSGKLSYGAGGKRMATVMIFVSLESGDGEKCMEWCGATPPRSTRRLERRDGKGCKGALSRECRQNGFRGGGSPENFNDTESFANWSVLGVLNVIRSHGWSSKLSASLRLSQPAQFPMTRSCGDSRDFISVYLFRCCHKKKVISFLTRLVSKKIAFAQTETATFRRGGSGEGGEPHGFEQISSADGWHSDQWLVKSFHSWLQHFHILNGLFERGVQGQRNLTKKKENCKMKQNLQRNLLCHNHRYAREQKHVSSKIASTSKI